MVKTIEGELSGQGRKIGIVVSRFNSFITERLLEGAVDVLVRHGVADDDITVVRVPGSFEVPLTTKRMTENGKYEAVLALSAVIRGATPHFDYVSSEIAKGVAQVGLESGVPVIFGVITADTVQQAVERAGSKSGNKGADAAMSALEMISVLAKL
jgi:6,7-dimethyl-8-ribityllumazine synthase